MSNELEVREGKRRRKLTYREVFFMHNGPGPYPCVFCNEDVAAISVTVHHEDHDGTNHAVENLKPSHVSCHMKHHNAGYVMPPEEREKRRLGRLGKVQSIEARKKMSIAKSGRTLSENHKKKLSAAHKGRKLSEEHKAALRAGYERWQTNA